MGVEIAEGDGLRVGAPEGVADAVADGTEVDAGVEASGVGTNASCFANPTWAAASQLPAPGAGVFTAPGGVAVG